MNFHQYGKNHFIFFHSSDTVNFIVPLEKTNNKIPGEEWRDQRTDRAYFIGPFQLPLRFQ